MVGSLVGHTGKVNCVRWAPSSATTSEPSTSYLFTGSADKTVRVWAWHGARPDDACGLPSAASGAAGAAAKEGPWRCVAVLQGHEAPVTCLAALHRWGSDELTLVRPAHGAAMHACVRACVRLKLAVDG